MLGPDAAGRQIGLLRLACALLHLARIGEGRARAYFTYARNGKRLPGFEEVLELAPENELFFLALRRFRSLLQAGGAWSVRDADWLRLRVGHGACAGWRRGRRRCAQRRSRGRGAQAAGRPGGAAKAVPGFRIRPPCGPGLGRGRIHPEGGHELGQRRAAPRGPGPGLA